MAKDVVVANPALARSMLFDDREIAWAVDDETKFGVRALRAAIVSHPEPQQVKPGGSYAAAHRARHPRPSYGGDCAGKVSQEVNHSALRPDYPTTSDQQEPWDSREGADIVEEDDDGGFAAAEDRPEQLPRFSSSAPGISNESHQRSFDLAHQPEERNAREHNRHDTAPSLGQASTDRASSLWTPGPAEFKPTREQMNEQHVRTEADMLLFSRKARPVESFRPYSLRDFRRSNPRTYVALGKLPPDLDTPELVAKRANIERIKEFSRNLRAINLNQSAQSNRVQRPRPLPPPPEPTVQERALAFAKTIPKPVAVARATSRAVKDRSSGSSGGGSGSGSGSVTLSGKTASSCPGGTKRNAEQQIKEGKANNRDKKASPAKGHRAVAANKPAATTEWRAAAGHTREAPAADIMLERYAKAAGMIK